MGISEGNLALNVLLHLGTLVAIVIVYFRSVKNMIVEFFAMIRDLIVDRSMNIYKNKYRKYIMLIIMASIPTAIIGLTLDDFFEELFTSIQVVAFTLIITGILLVIGERAGKNNVLPIEKLTLKQGFFVGLFQSIAITPGISRSGSTIVGGLFNGLQKEEATEFSFLISIPAVLGAVVLKGKDILGLEALGMETTTLAASFLASVVFGVFAIKLLVRLVRNGKLYYFSYYCWAMSAFLLIRVFVLG
jgi:undecaprenyl-diphosphatase